MKNNPQKFWKKKNEKKLMKKINRKPRYDWDWNINLSNIPQWPRRRIEGVDGNYSGGVFYYPWYKRNWAAETPILLSCTPFAPSCSSEFNFQEEGRGIVETCSDTSPSEKNMQVSNSDSTHSSDRPDIGSMNLNDEENCSTSIDATVPSKSAEQQPRQTKRRFKNRWSSYSV